jgi:hypothetical protein
LFALSNGDNSRATLSKLGNADSWTEVAHDDSPIAALPAFTSARLQALSETSILVANQYSTKLYVDGSSPQTLGGVDTGGNSSLYAHSATDIWEGTNGGSMLHVIGDAVDSYCLSTGGTACTTTFVTGIFHDGSKLWVATASDASGQDWGIWSVKPAAPGNLTPTLGIAGVFQTIVPGAGSTAWGVGENGIAAHYDGATWTAQPTGTTLVLNAAVVAQNGEVWAGAPKGIVHFDGTTWKTVTGESGMPAGLESVAINSDGTVLVTHEGKLYRRRP